MHVHCISTGTSAWPNDAGRLLESHMRWCDEPSGIVCMSQPFLPLSGFHPTDANDTEAARCREDRARNSSFHEVRERYR